MNTTMCGRKLGPEAVIFSLICPTEITGSSWPVAMALKKVLCPVHLTYVLFLAIGTSTGPTGASQETVPATWMSPQVTQQPTDVSSGTCDMTTPAPTTMGLTAFHSQGTVSISPLASPTPSGGTLVWEGLTAHWLLFRACLWTLSTQEAVWI